MTAPIVDDRKLVWTRVRDLKPFQKSVNVKFIVLKAGPRTPCKTGGTLTHFEVADASGCVNMSVWDCPENAVRPGDIYELGNGYTSMFKSSLTLYLTMRGVLTKVGEFEMLFTDTFRASATVWMQDPDHPSDHTRLVEAPREKQPAFNRPFFA